MNLEEGDVVITATDGLFDNLYEKEIVSIVCRSLERSLEPQVLSVFNSFLFIRVETKKAYLLLHQCLLNLSWGI